MEMDQFDNSKANEQINSRESTVFQRLARLVLAAGGLLHNFSGERPGKIAGQ